MDSFAELAPTADGSTLREEVRRVFITGLALLIPLVLTLVVLQIALNLVSQVVSPLVAGVRLVFGWEEQSALVLEVVAVSTLGVLILVIGAVAEYGSDSGRLSRGFDALMARIPGLGGVYSGIRRMSDVLLEQDTGTFREVKLVEFPRDGSFVLGFLTAEPPDTVREVAGHPEMWTLFIPLAPNPVMGGFLVHLPDDRVYDVDLTVEEGVQSIVTSGTATDPRVAAAADGRLEDVDLFEGIEADLLADAPFTADDEEE